MYLLPWQIFVLGCICGIFISFFMCVILIIRIIFRHGARIERIKNEKEEEDNG